jgi:hypothetical protein
MRPMLNIPRADALRTAPLNAWIALAEDESKVIATGATYEEVSHKLDEAGVEDSIIIKTPLSWHKFAV